MDWLLHGIGELWSVLVTDINLLLSPDWWRSHWVPLFNVLMIDLTLAGDNAIVVGLAASRVDPSIRNKVIFWGIAGAVLLRIVFAAITQQMLQIIGLTLAGGLLLLFVCWKMYRQIVDHHGPGDDGAGTVGAPANPASFWSALWTIILADVSMSLDNVLAVAGAAGESTLVLVIGLAIAIILMAAASTVIANMLGKYPWIAWLGLIIILIVALEMIYRDGHKVACQAYGIGCSETLWQAIKHRIGLGG